MQSLELKPCPKCGCKLKPNNYEKHIKKQHSPEAIAQKERIQKEALENSQRKIIEGKEIVKCTICGVSLAKRNINHHITKVHSAQSKTNKENTLPNEPKKIFNPNRLKNKKKYLDLTPKKVIPSEEIGQEENSIWLKWIKDYSPNNREEENTLRLASRVRNAYDWTHNISAPVSPITPLSNATVYDGWWCNKPNLSFEQRHLTLRDLQRKILLDVKNGKTEYPFIWWVYTNQKTYSRRIYEDAYKRTFVKLDSLWQLAVPIRAAGGLIGNGSSGNYNKVPENDYAAIWPKRDDIVKHRGYEVELSVRKIKEDFSSSVPYENQWKTVQGGSPGLKKRR